MTALTYNEHGIDGRHIGYIGVFEYALRTSDQSIWRRVVPGATYGGWRWECDLAHARRYPDVYGALLTNL